jgi:hypothetical protein
VVEKNPRSDDEGEEKKKASGEEGVGPRFKKGSEDLDQLEGIEKQQHRSRKARRAHEQDDAGDDPEQTYPVIDEIEKSKQRLKNRFKNIKDPEDAIDEFGS